MTMNEWSCIKDDDEKNRQATGSVQALVHHIKSRAEGCLNATTSPLRGLLAYYPTKQSERCLQRAAKSEYASGETATQHS